MKWSWRVGQISGIDIKIHATFVLALLWGAMIWGRGLEGAPYGALLTLALFGFVLLHELGHAIMARRYNIRVHDIVLLPIGGVARLSRAPDEPAQELMVALAGPAVNVVLALLAAPFVVAALAGQAVTGVAVALPELTRPGLGNLAWFVLAINLSLLIFNMIPAFPMDGGRVLRALLAMRMRYSRATQVAAAVGKVLAILFGVFGIASGNFSLTLVAIFVFMGAGAENQDALLREQLREVSITEALDREAPVLSVALPTYVAFERLLRSPYRALALVDDAGEYIGMVTRGGLQRLWSAGVRGDLVQFVEPTDLRLDCDASLDDARIRMAESNAPVAPVFCGARFAGLLDIESIGRVVTMRRHRYASDSRSTTQPTEA